LNRFLLSKKTNIQRDSHNEERNSERDKISPNVLGRFEPKIHAQRERRRDDSHHHALPPIRQSASHYQRGAPHDTSREELLVEQVNRGIAEMRRRRLAVVARGLADWRQGVMMGIIPAAFPVEHYFWFKIVQGRLD